MIILQVNALLETLELKDSAQRKGHFALYKCLVLGHTKYNGVQRVYCNPFPAKPLYGSHRLGLVMIRPPGIDNGAFVVTPDSVWYARDLLLFSASAQTYTGSKSFDCALVSMLEHMTILRMVIIDIVVIIVFIAFIFVLFNYCYYCHYEGYYNYSDY